MNKKLISKKKPVYPISKELTDYLIKNGRNIKIPICYDDLLRYQGAVSIFDKNGDDTLWLSTYFSGNDQEEIELGLKKIYTILHADGNDSTLPFISVDSIDYCTFGNTKPFRIKIRNILNLETCISVVAAYFYEKFVHKVDKENIDYKNINMTRYIDWFITTPLMILVLCLAFLYNLNKSL